jgi:hypothetical protein
MKKRSMRCATMCGCVLQAVCGALGAPENSPGSFCRALPRARWPVLAPPLSARRFCIARCGSPDECMYRFTAGSVSRVWFGAVALGRCAFWDLCTHAEDALADADDASIYLPYHKMPFPITGAGTRSVSMASYLRAHCASVRNLMTMQTQ